MNSKNDPKRLRVFSFSSRGLSTRSKSPFDNTLLDKFSKLERKFFELVKFNRYIKKLESQVWLNIDETIKISNELEISHPRHKGTHAQMSTDFLITFKNDTKIAVTVKYISDLTIQFISKMDIEKSYWQSKNVDYKLFTENDYCKTDYRNFLFLNDNFNEENINEYSKYFQEFKSYSFENKFSITIDQANKSVCERLNWTLSKGFKSFKLCVINGLFTFDKNSELKADIHLTDLSFGN
jgi:hypothetical protein